MNMPTYQIGKFIIPALLFLVNVQVWADLPKPHNFPGGISLIPVGDHAHKPQVFFGIDPVLVIRKDEEWTAVVGVPMNMIPGKYMLRVEYTEDSARQRSMMPFTIYPLHSKYKQRSFTLPEKFTPDQFIGLDNRQLRGMFDTHVPEFEPTTPVFNFQHVIKKGSFLPFGRILSQNGNQDMRLEDHPKITYLASGGTIAYAPGNGIVENIVDRGAADQKIVIRHSDHFRSILNFVNNSPLEVGDQVEAGEPVGTASLIESIGTGRIDWYLMLNGTEIDPLLLIEHASEQE
ncbi:MAG: M23 family metallopeptidase [Gammaproteobacteria bacterium]|nr:M23 family metallopeptidase [Gammaproteobacteria bacterium]